MTNQENTLHWLCLVFLNLYFCKFLPKNQGRKLRTKISYIDIFPQIVIVLSTPPTSDTFIFICFFNVYIKKETINPLFHDLYFKFCELFFNDIQYILEHCLNDDSKKSKLIKDITTPIVEKIILRTQINGF